jgi:hypothetical protein
MVITAEYILNEGTLLQVQNYMNELQRLLENREGAYAVCSNHQVVLEFVSDNGKDVNACTYYFVDHEHQSIFWVHEFPADTLVEQVRGKIEYAHLGQCM